MSRATRDAIDVAVRLGLEVVRVEKRSRHTFLVVKNACGHFYAQPFNASGQSKHRQFTSMRVNLQRFARGDTHGLFTRKDNL